MKKLLTILFFVTALNCSGQDTMYVQNRHRLFMVVKSQVTDSVLYKSHYRVRTKRQKHKDAMISVTAGAIFVSMVFLIASK